VPATDLPLRLRVLLSAGRALWEVPTPALRAVAVAWDEQWLRPRFVYDSEPTETERELVSLFGTCHVADFASHRVDERIDVLPCPHPVDLNPGEEWLYLRYEPENQ
jgi:hypothetical protein